MQSGSASDSDIIVGINVTPLVDITLVLLIIFIVTAKIIVTPAVPLDLPQAAKTDEVQMVFSVIVETRGTILVNGAPVNGDADLLAGARAALAANSDVRAVIQADGGVTHRAMIHVLDLLRQAGIERIAFAAVPTDDAAGSR
jgi:biopolymer transport protein ExbD